MSSIGPVVSEEKMFENVDRRRTDGRRSHCYTKNEQLHAGCTWIRDTVKLKFPTVYPTIYLPK